MSKAIQGIDWKELREQKRHLAGILMGKNSSITAKQGEAIEGILNLLDCIQDEAALELGEEVVFYKLSKPRKKK